MSAYKSTKLNYTEVHVTDDYNSQKVHSFRFNKEGNTVLYSQIITGRAVTKHSSVVHCYKEYQDRAAKLLDGISVSVPKDRGMDFLRIQPDAQFIRVDELEWMKQGLSQTASGYGSKLTTRYKVTARIDGETREYRVYKVCFLNCATHYILVEGRKVVVDLMNYREDC